MLETPDDEPGLNWLCEELKAFFAHTERSMRIMDDLLSRGKLAAVIMKTLWHPITRRPIVLDHGAGHALTNS